MTLRAQINLIVGVLTLLFMTLVIWLQFNGIRDSVREEVMAANRVAAQLLERTARRYADQGTPAMLQFLQGVGRVRSNDITLLDAQGGVLYRSPPSAYKAGLDAPPWFAALVSPPPAMQAIQFPDGRLEVRANASRATLDEWEHFVALVAGSAALLLAANGLVFWLVGRAVRPFGVIVAALDTLQAGRFDVALPRLPGTEAATIGAAFNRMVGVLQQNIETERRAASAESALSDSRELTRWIEHHVEQERRLIARELHDELGQSVTAIRSLALSVAQRTTGRDAESEQAATLIAQESSRLYDAMHGLIPRLTPLVLDNFGLSEALTDLVERTRKAHAQAKLELAVDLGSQPLPPDVALTLYRAAQEGITNALQHGKAQHVRVSVQAKPEGLDLSIVDDGTGLPEDWQQRPGHYGLRWLAERVQGLDGSLHVENTPPQGVRLAVKLPVEGLKP